MSPDRMRENSALKCAHVSVVVFLVLLKVQVNRTIQTQAVKKKIPYLLPQDTRTIIEMPTGQEPYKSQACAHIPTHLCPRCYDTKQVTSTTTASADLP